MVVSVAVYALFNSILPQKLFSGLGREGRESLLLCSFLDYLFVPRGFSFGCVLVLVWYQ